MMTAPQSIQYGTLPKKKSGKPFSPTDPSTWGGVADQFNAGWDASAGRSSGGVGGAAGTPAGPSIGAAWNSTDNAFDMLMRDQSPNAAIGATLREGQRV